MFRGGLNTVVFSNDRPNKRNDLHFGRIISKQEGVRKVKVVPFLKQWAKQFRNEADNITAIFREECVEIHHISEARPFLACAQNRLWNRTLYILEHIEPRRQGVSFQHVSDHRRFLIVSDAPMPFQAAAKVMLEDSWTVYPI